MNEGLNGFPQGLGTLIPSGVLISSATASSSAAIDFTTGINSTYDEYEIHFNTVLPATDDTDLWLRMSVDGGATFLAGASAYSNASSKIVLAAQTLVDSADTKIIVATVVSNTTLEGGASGVIRLIRPSSTDHKKRVLATSGCYGTAPNADNLYQVSGRLLSSSAVNAYRLLLSSGNITSGNFYLYGVKKS